MKIAFFDTHRFDKNIFELLNKKFRFSITFIEPRLTTETASLAATFPVVCSFANDHVDKKTLQILKEGGTQLLALRCAGFNHVDLKAAKENHIQVVRVPAYSPHSVAEHAIALILSLNRKIPKAHSRVREGNFSLEGLVGFDIYGKTVGVIGTGKIGTVVIKILNGFGAKVLAYDIQENKSLSKLCQYTSLSELYKKSDIISLHVPLTPKTKHLINEKALYQMKKGVMLINTGRGALIDTKALIKALKNEKIGYAGLDVYEEEEGVFFNDLSEKIIQDDQLARLLTFPNVLITAHQAFLTEEALHNIAETTLENILAFSKGKELVNKVSAL